MKVSVQQVMDALDESSVSTTMFPTLLTVSKLGKDRLWKTWAEANRVYSAYGEVGGKIIVSAPTVAEPKNVGKKNETTAEDQAKREAARAWVKQLGKGYEVREGEEGYALYRTVIEERDRLGGKALGLDTLVLSLLTRSPRFTKQVESTAAPVRKVATKQAEGGIPLPILATTWDPSNPKHLDFRSGVFVQPKLDGVRALAYLNDGEVVFPSRSGKYYPHFHTARAQLTELLTAFSEENGIDLILDGEVYADELIEPRTGRKIPDAERFSLIAGAGGQRRTKADIYDDQLQYFVFDIAGIRDSEVGDQTSRYEIVDQLAELIDRLELTAVRIVPRYEVHSADEALQKAATFIEAGYEGIILRDRKLPYKSGQRSQYMKKYKEFDDTECTIVGFESGVGKEKGAVIWKCQLGEAVFSVRPVGSIEERKALMKKAPTFLGYRLTIKYQGLSKDGVPRFPVGKGVRLEFTDTAE